MSLKESDKYVQLPSSSSCATTTIALTSTVLGKPNFQSSNGSEIQNVYENSLTTASKHDISSSCVVANFMKQSVDPLPSSVTSETNKKDDFILVKTETCAFSKSNDVDCDKGITSNTFCEITGSERQMTSNSTDFSISVSSLKSEKDTSVPNSFLIANTNSVVTASLFSESTPLSKKFFWGNAIMPTSLFTAASSHQICDTKTTDILSYRSDVTTTVSNIPYSFFKFSVSPGTPAFAFTNTSSSSLNTMDTTSIVTTSSDCFPTSSQFSLGRSFPTPFYTRPFSEVSRTSVSAASSANLPLQTANATSSSLAFASTSSSRYFTSGISAPVTTSSSSSSSAALSTIVSAGTDANQFSFRNENLTSVTTTTPFASVSSSVYSASYSNQPSNGNVITTPVTTFIHRNASPLNRKARRLVRNWNRRHRQVVWKNSKNSVEAPLGCTETFNLDTKKSKCSSLDLKPSLHNLESLSQDLGNLLEKKLIADVHLECNGQIFPAHKTILAARSDFFAEMFFQQESSERHTEKIPFPEFKPEVLAVFLKYLYTGRLPEDLTEDVVCELYAAAHKYRVRCLSKLCSDWMISRLSDSNYLKWFKLADDHQDSELIEAEASFLTKELLTSGDWVKFADEHQRLAIKIYQKYIEKSILTSRRRPPLKKFPRKQ